MVLIAEYLPPREQALRLLAKVEGEAAQLLEQVPVNELACEEGVPHLMGVLRPHFDQRNVANVAEDLLAFENFSRRQGEQVAAGVTRFLTLEMRLTSHHNVQPLADPMRVIKFLRAMRLDERGVQSVLSSTGNKLEFDRVREALLTLYPRGRQVLAAPTGGNGAGKGAQSRPWRKGKGKGKSKSKAHVTEDDPYGDPMQLVNNDVDPEDELQYYDEEAQAEDDYAIDEDEAHRPRHAL